MGVVAVERSIIGGLDADDQMSSASGVLKWEMATQTDYVKILDPGSETVVEQESSRKIKA